MIQIQEEAEYGILERRSHGAPFYEACSLVKQRRHGSLPLEWQEDEAYRSVCSLVQVVRVL